MSFSLSNLQMCLSFTIFVQYIVTIDEHETELMLIWDKAQRGEKVEKIQR